MARTPSPNEPIADDRGLPTRSFAAWLREMAREQAQRAELLDALIAHLISEEIIEPDWNE